jgi:hypothetical protein
MKYIITESKLNKLIYHWLETEYGNLPFKTPKGDDTWFYYMKNGKVVMDYYSKYKRFTMSDDIVNFLDKFFNISYFDAKKIVGKWFQDSYNLEAEVLATPVDTIYKNWEYMSNR